MFLNYPQHYSGQSRVHYIEYAILSTLHWVRYIEYATFSTLYWVHYIQYAILSMLYSVRYIEYTMFSYCVPEIVLAKTTVSKVLL